MSSPLGGYYIAAHNRKKQKQFELDSRTKIQLRIALKVANKVVLDEQQSIVCGELSLFESSQYLIKVQTEILDSGLLKVDSCVDGISGHLGNQVVNLEPAEEVETLVEANSNIKLSVFATAL